MTSPRFAQAWVQANTAGPPATGEGAVRPGQQLGQRQERPGRPEPGPVHRLVKQDLASRGFTLVSKLPAINPTLTLFSAKYLVKAQTGYRLINDLKIVLPILTLLLLGLGVYVARGRRRALIGAGLGVAASMLVLAAGLLIFRGIYLNSVPTSKLPADAAAALFDTLVAFIKDSLRTVLVAGPDHRRWRVPGRAVRHRGPDPGGVHARTGLDPPRRRAPGVSTGPVGQVDLRAPQERCASAPWPWPRWSSCSGASRPPWSSS